MHRLVFLLLFITALICGCHQAPKPVTRTLERPSHDGDSLNTHIKIPDEWVEKVRQFDYSHNTRPLLHEFESFIKPDILMDPHAVHVAEDYGRVLDPIFTDIDGEPGEELICLLGWDITCPDLCVFKKMGNYWFLIYREQIDTFYSSPTLNIANNFSKHKVFYIDHVDAHGTGSYYSSYSFYKLINGQVHKCLELPGDIEMLGNERSMGRNVVINIDFNGDDSDEVFVKYTYEFTLIRTDGQTISILKNEAGVAYEWNEKQSKYILRIKPFQNTIDDLTTEQVKCLSWFSDSLFVKAFKRQIDFMLKTGTNQQKRSLKQYLSDWNK